MWVLFRLCSQVTEAVQGPLRNSYDFRCRGSVSIKGKGDMTTYYIMGKKPNSSDSACTVCSSCKKEHAVFYLGNAKFSRQNSHSSCTYKELNECNTSPSPGSPVADGSLQRPASFDMTVTELEPNMAVGAKETHTLALPVDPLTDLPEVHYRNLRTY